MKVKLILLAAIMLPNICSAEIVNKERINSNTWEYLKFTDSQSGESEVGAAISQKESPELVFLRCNEGAIVMFSVGAYSSKNHVYNTKITIDDNKHIESPSMAMQDNKVHMTPLSKIKEKLFYGSEVSLETQGGNGLMTNEHKTISFSLDGFMKSYYFVEDGCH